MSPIIYPVVDFFLLGFIAACSLVAGLFFFKFWRSTRDPLFLAFLVFFVVQGCTNAAILSLEHPNQGNLLVFVIRLLSVLLVVGAILWKNLERAEHHNLKPDLPRSPLSHPPAPESDNCQP